MTTTTPCSANETTSPNDAIRREFGLLDVLLTWWRARTRVVLIALTSGVIAAGIFTVAYVLIPTYRESTLIFRLTFSSAQKGLYPNGTQFFPADIVGERVLQEVYRQNSLAKYIDFDDFKKAFTVLTNNPELDRLRRETEPRLEDRHLESTDRIKLEDEYEDKIKSLKNNELTLVCAMGDKFARWPADLTARVMNEILSTWAEQSKNRGIFKFDIDVLSSNLVRDNLLEDEDYPILVDQLRILIHRIENNLDELSKIPGVHLIRVGEHKVSLGEIRASLEDSLRFRLSVIQGPIYTFGIFKNRLLAEVYINERLFRLQLEAQEIASKAEVLPQAMNIYLSSRNVAGRVGEGTPSQQGTSPIPFNNTNAVIPQISESFIDRVVSLSTQNADLAFRQELSRDEIDIAKELAANSSERQIYEKMKKALDEPPSTDLGKSRANILQQVSTQINLLIAELKDDLNNIQLLHEEISRKSLQPETTYLIVMPFMQEHKPMVSMLALAFVIGLLWCVSVGATLVVVAWRALPSANTLTESRDR